MPLSVKDLKQIKDGLPEVVDPQFTSTNKRLDQTNQRLEDTNQKIESRFGQIKTDIDNLAAATNRKFHVVFTDLAVARDDLQSVKQLVSEHGFRLSQLEGRSEPK